MQSKARHNLELLLPWLDGGKTGGLEEKSQQQSRLKIHYVAMTRPTHLLCLAMKRATFVDQAGKPDGKLIQALERRDWHLQFLS